MEMEVFKKVVLQRSQAYPIALPWMEHSHIHWAAGLVRTLKAAVKMRNTLHLDRTKLACAGPSGRGILRSQCGT